MPKKPDTFTPSRSFRRQPNDQEREAVLEFLRAVARQVLGGEASELASDSDKRAVPEIVRGFGDHPPAWTRQALMRAYWSDSTPGSLNAEQKAFGQVAILMGRRLEALWGNLGPIWVQIVKQDRR